MFTFNSKGFLVPNLNIQSSVKELEVEFVTKIGSDRRRLLFENYIRYSNSLKKELEYVPFLQWVDGSFVSKKHEPEDFDVVSFISYQELQADKHRLDEFKYPLSLGNFEIDAYIVLVYPREHKNYPLYAGDRLYWMDLFDKAKRSRNGIKNPKGFLELNF